MIIQVLSNLSATDGSEDCDIDCIALGEVAAEAAPEIAWLTFGIKSVVTLSLTLVTITEKSAKTNKLLVDED